ncbi:hypothetical protein ABZ851_33345 [Streptomyces sp. NPDC047049]
MAARPLRDSNPAPPVECACVKAKVKSDRSAVVGEKDENNAGR